MFFKIKKFFFLAFFILGFAGLIDMQTPGFSFVDLITLESSNAPDLSLSPLAEDFASQGEKTLADDDTPNDDFHLSFEFVHLKAFLQKNYDGGNHSVHPEPFTDNLVPPPERQA